MLRTIGALAGALLLASAGAQAHGNHALGDHTHGDHTLRSQVELARPFMSISLDVPWQTLPHKVWAAIDLDGDGRLSAAEQARGTGILSMSAEAPVVTVHGRPCKLQPPVGIEWFADARAVRFTGRYGCPGQPHGLAVRYGFLERMCAALPPAGPDDPGPVLLVRVRQGTAQALASLGCGRALLDGSSLARVLAAAAPVAPDAPAGRAPAPAAGGWPLWLLMAGGALVLALGLWLLLGRTQSQA